MKNILLACNAPSALFQQFLHTLASLLLFCGLSAPVYGQTRVVQFTTNSIRPQSITVNYPDAVCTLTASTYTVSAGDNTLSFSAGGASPFQIIQQANAEDCSITADFPLNEKVLAVNTVSTGVRSPLTITFSAPVTEMEFQAQIFGYGTERFTFQVFNGEESLAIFTVEDQMDFTQTGLKGYIGARTSGDDRITKVKVWAEFPDDPKHNEAVANKFAIGPISFRLDRDQ
jgi:hypothetical protein